MFPKGLVRAAVRFILSAAFLLGVFPVHAEFAYRDPATGVYYRTRPLPGYGGYTGSVMTSVVIITWPPNVWPPVEVPPFQTSHSFGGTAADGRGPINLVGLSDGSFVGSTSAGGVSGAGTLFRLSQRPTSIYPWVTVVGGPRLLTLHEFGGAAGGATPIGNLVATSDGTVYGMTASGGANGAGTIFRWNAVEGHSIVHSFGKAASAEAQTDSPSLVSPRRLLRATDGTIYGLAHRESATTSVVAPLPTQVLFKLTSEGIEEVGSLRLPQIILRTPWEPSMAQAGDGSIVISSHGLLYLYREGRDISPVTMPAGWSSPDNLIRGIEGKIHGTVFVAGATSVFTYNPDDQVFSLVPGGLRDIPPVIVPTQTPAPQLDPSGFEKEGGGIIIINPPWTPNPPFILSLAGRPTSLLQDTDGTFYGTWAQPIGKDYIFSVLPTGGTNIIHTFDGTPGRAPTALTQGTDRVLYGVLTRVNPSFPTAFGATFDLRRPVPAANLPPIANKDRFRRTTVDGQEVLIADVLANDRDPEGKPLRVFRAHTATGIAVAVSPTGTLTIPATADGGNPTVTYEITDEFGGFATGTVVLENVAPVANSDVFRLAPSRAVQSLQVLANDTDADGDGLTILRVSATGAGQVEVSSDRKRLLYRTPGTFKAQDSFKYTVTDGYGGTSQTTVRIVNTMLNVPGNYSTLIGRPNAIGTIRVTVSKDMALTGSLQMGSHVYRIIGNLDSGEAHFQSRVGGKVLRLTIGVDTSGPRTRLTVEVDDGNANIVAELTRRAVAPDPAHVGKYTLTLPLAPGADQRWPDGNGFAILVVGEQGRARISGRLGDGTPFSSGADFAPNRTLPVFARAYRAVKWLPGGLTGTLEFSDLPESDVRGLLRWFKPDAWKAYQMQIVHGVPRQVLRSAGAEGMVAAAGSRYTPTDPGINPAPLWHEGAMLHLEGGKLPDKVKKRVRFIDEHQVEVTPVGMEQISLEFDNDFGFLRGEFLHPERDGKTQIEGVILQKTGRATGLFPGPGKSVGWFTIEPRD